MVQELLTLGSRGSPLALAQTHMTRDLLAKALGLNEIQAKAQILVRTFTTSGDKLQDRSLVEAGGKGLFTRELERALIDGEIDVAVHSMKDVPIAMPDGLKLAGMLPREDPREALIAKTARTLADLPDIPVIGTASVRRQSQATRARPDAKIVMLRGNVGTRLKRLDEGLFDATFLAFAGLKRLGMPEAASGILDPDDMLPSPAQGAVGLQIRADDHERAEMLQPICCSDTAVELAAERAFLAALDGSCRTPIAALARLSGDVLSFAGEAFAVAGDGCWQRSFQLTFEHGNDKLVMAVQMGREAGLSIADEAGDAIRFIA